MIATRQQVMLIVSLLLISCRPSLWAQTTAPVSLATSPAPDVRYRKEYVILPGDQLDIIVRRVPEATRSVVVRPDGEITLPLVNDVTVAGLTTHEVDLKLASLLSVRLVNPEVTVIAAQAHQPTVYVGGEVNTPGAIPLRNASFAIQAISLAGGLRRSAAARNITILRLSDDGKIQSLPLEVTARGQRGPYEALARTRLLPDDIIFVPESGRSQVNRFIDDFINHPLQGVNSILGTYVNFRLIQIINKSVQQQ